MNTTVARSLNGTHIGRMAERGHGILRLDDRDVYIVSITHSKSGIVTVRWGYEATSPRLDKAYKQNEDVRYHPDAELRLV